MTPFQYQFPRIDGISSLMSQIVKIETEVSEAIDALAKNEGDLRVAEELMDVIHATETALRMLKFEPFVMNAVKAGVVSKNAARGYYDAA